MLIPDVNVWLALTFDAHEHHPAAKSWFDAAADDSCHFCRTTQQGYLRVATNGKAFGASALTLDGAWRAYDALASDPRVSFAGEPADVEARWRELTTGGTFSPKVWTDAYLAAFAAAGGLEVVTFDRGFARFAGVRRTILS